MATNLVTKTEDFSHADWSNDTVTVTANTTAAPTFAGGSAGLADTLADNSAVVQGSLFSTYRAIANNATDWMTSVFIRKDATTTRFPEITMQMIDGVGLYCGVQINTSTGAIANSLDGAPDAKGVVDFDALWWRVWLRKANNASGNTSLRMGIFPARAGTIGGSDSSTTGSIIAWGANQTNDSTVQTYAPDPTYSFATTLPAGDVTTGFRAYINANAAGADVMPKLRAALASSTGLAVAGDISMLMAKYIGR